MMEFELRKLKSDDMFLMFNILSKIGFKDLKEVIDLETIKKLTENNSENDAITFLGMNIVMDITSVIIKNLSSCKLDIYTFLSSLSGMSSEEISELDMITLTEMVIEVIKKEEFKDFFKVVSRLFK